MGERAKNLQVLACGGKNSGLRPVDFKRTAQARFAAQRQPGVFQVEQGLHR